MTAYSHPRQLAISLAVAGIALRAISLRVSRPSHKRE